MALECKDCNWTGSKDKIILVMTKHPYMGCPVCYSKKLKEKSDKMPGREWDKIWNKGG